MIEVYDTTLRDGTQREGLSLSCDDATPKDAEFFRRARDMTLAERQHRGVWRHPAGR